MRKIREIFCHIKYSKNPHPDRGCDLAYLSQMEEIVNHRSEQRSELEMLRSVKLLPW
jgi:hypothetical protein